MPHRSSRFKDALYFAAQKHDGQYRKGGSRVPYFTHPVLVSMGVSIYTDNEDIIIAALLHDVIEDCDVLFGEIEELFSNNVARIVEEVSATSDYKKEQWKERKQCFLNKMASVSKDALMVGAVDKMVNMKAYFDALETHGEKEIMKYFGGSVADYIWYYDTFGIILKNGFGESHKIVLDYVSVLDTCKKKNPQ